MARHFTSRRKHDVIKAKEGFDFVTVDLGFVPELIQVSFGNQQLKSAAKDDELSWDLVSNGKTAQLIISYDVVGASRNISYTASVPSVDPEMTIAS